MFLFNSKDGHRIQIIMCNAGLGARHGGVCVKCRRVAVNLKRSEISEYKLRIKRVGELEMLSPFNWSGRCVVARRWRCRVVGGVAKATEQRRATEPPPSRSRGRGARRGAVEIVRLRRVPIKTRDGG